MVCMSIYSSNIVYGNIIVYMVTYPHIYRGKWIVYGLYGYLMGRFYKVYYRVHNIEHRVYTT